MKESQLPFHPRLDDQLERRRRAVLPDGRAHIPYVYGDDLILAVNAALATNRPLLIRGDPGCGKSTVARDIAFALDRDYLEEVVTSRTTAMDLQWRFDAVGRLNDATAKRARVKTREHYVRRGALWRAFERDGSELDAVLLLDEIDKADPDVPNDLLLPLGDGRFVVTDLDPPREVQRGRAVLIVITTNGERELPPAFLRRCVSLTLELPSEALLLQISRAHLARDRAEAKHGASGASTELDPALLGTILARVKDLTSKLAVDARRAGTAEILDALKATLSLGIGPADSSEWNKLTRALLYKEPGDPDAGLVIER